MPAPDPCRTGQLWGAGLRECGVAESRPREAGLLGLSALGAKRLARPACGGALWVSRAGQPRSPNAECQTGMVGGVSPVSFAEVPAAGAQSPRRKLCGLTPLVLRGARMSSSPVSRLRRAGTERSGGWAKQSRRAERRGGARQIASQASCAGRTVPRLGAERIAGVNGKCASTGGERSASLGSVRPGCAGPSCSAQTWPAKIDGTLMRWKADGAATMAGGVGR